LIFTSVEAFFSSAAGVVVEEQSHGLDDGSDWVKYHRQVIEVGGDQYELTVEQSHDCEGDRYEETWRKNGQLHRDGGFAAVTVFSYHAIPEETHLDESVRRYFKEGRLLEEKDSTYEEILRTKPLAVRQHFGCDV